MNKSNQSDELKDLLREKINENGHAFQAIAQKISDETYEATSNGIYEIAEFPIDSNGFASSIDFILKNKINNPWENRNIYTYLLFECKRSNPKFKDWCFLKLPHIFNNRVEDKYNWFISSLTKKSGTENIKIVPSIFSSEKIFNLGYEIRTKEKGNSGGKGQGQIDDAITQILRNTYGFYDFFQKNVINNYIQEIITIPIILTTGNLYSSNLDLGQSDIETGNFNNDFSLKPEKWVFFQYHVSTGLVPQNTFSEKEDKKRSLTEILLKNYFKTIIFLNAKNLKEFLEKFTINPDLINEIY